MKRGESGVSTKKDKQIEGENKNESATVRTSSNVLQNSLVGAFYLIALQVGSRVLTFILNTWMVTAVDTGIYGIFAIEYQLVASIILFLSREAIRRTCIRVDLLQQTDDNQLVRIVNLSWLVVPIGVFMSYGTYYLFESRMADKMDIQFYQEGLLLFTIASLLELCSEPVYILTQNLLLFKVRTLVEGSALFLKGVSTYYLVVMNNEGLKGFGYAQIVYSLVLIVGYYGYFIIDILKSNKKKQKDQRVKITQLSQLLPKVVGVKTLVGNDLWYMTAMYTWQSIQKLMLTEGEKMVMYATSIDLIAQGIFSVVSNLGSLVARFFLQPIEESCFAMFPKLFANKSDWTTGHKVLTLLMKMMVIIGLTFMAFGASYAGALLHLLYRGKFDNSNAPIVMGVYCVYVAFLAFNGVSEAFVHSVSKSEQLRRLNWILIIISITYLSCTALFSRLWGTTGIILASSTNMLLRIIYSLYFMSSFFKDTHDFSLGQMLPRKSVLMLYVMSFIITMASNHFIYKSTTSSLFMHIGIGCVCFGSIIVSLYLTELNTFKDFKRILKSKGN